MFKIKQKNPNNAEPFFITQFMLKVIPMEENDIIINIDDILNVDEKLFGICLLYRF